MRLQLTWLVGVALVAATVASSCNGGSSQPADASNAAGHGSTQLTVSCDQIIQRTRTPFADGFRSVLGVVSVAPAYVPQVVHLTGQGWPYWEKAGIIMRAGRQPVSVTVPAGWRTRAAISWGNGKPAAGSVRFSPCPSPPNVWNAYATGFYLRSHGACVPLEVQVGRRRRTVRFGIDRRC